MSVQKKCLTASAITHGLLVVLFFVGSAFAPQKPKPEPQMTPFELVNIPLNLVEEPNVVRGSASGNPPPAVTRDKLPPLLPKTDPAPVKPPEQPVKPAEQPKQEPVKLEPVKPLPRSPETFDITKAKTIKATDKPKEEPPKFNLKEATKKVVKTSATTQSTSQTANARENERASEIAKLLDGARQTLAGTGTRVDIQSDLTGERGEAQMSYDLAVAKD